MKEQWKSVKGFEDYEVSNLGRVKSLERLDSRGHRRKEKLLKPQKNSDNYLFIRLYKNRVVETFRINRLVYSTFIGEIPEGMQVNHIDEDKENNRVENLNLMTPKENCNWGTRNARRAAAQSKAVEAIDKVSGRVVFTFPSTREAQRQGFDHGAVSACCRNCYLRSGNNIYKGYIWRFKENAQEQ